MADAFDTILREAMEYFKSRGFTSAEVLDEWMRKLEEAMRAQLAPEWKIEEKLQQALGAVFRQQVDNGKVLARHPGVARYTLDRVRPELRAELSKRIAANAALIKLNRKQEIDATLRRFAGWASSVPTGGTPLGTKDAKEGIRKGFASLPFRERRVLIDQGAKLASAVSSIVATGGGAIGAIWFSHAHQKNYDFRVTHEKRMEESSKQPYLIRDSWAMQRGYIKTSGVKYTDQMTQPGEEVFCFPGDSSVDLFHDAEKLYKRPYTGRIVKITTASGNTLCATPNHPVMTSKGWVAVGDLEVGDNLIELRNKNIAPSKLNTNKNKTSFTDMFASAAVTGFGQRVHGMGADFHGDGTDQKIDVISFDGPLPFVYDFSLRKVFGEKIFVIANLLTSTVGFVHEHFYRLLSSAYGIVRSFGGQPAVVGANLTTGFNKTGHYGGLRDVVSFSQRMRATFAGFVKLSNLNRVNLFSRPWAKIDETFFMAKPQSHWSDADFFSDSAEGETLRTQTSDVVKIDDGFLSSHVYNLQTTTGWFVVNNIIVSNCRCQYRYIYHLRDLPPSMLTQKGTDELARVRALMAT